LDPARIGLVLVLEAVDLKLLLDELFAEQRRLGLEAGGPRRPGRRVGRDERDPERSGDQ
jgi:hypothetical protein